MYKILGALCVVALSSALAQTQEELAQFVARQQTLGAPQAPARRQAYFLPQGGQGASPQPYHQISQSKANAYSVATGAGPQPYFQSQQPAAAPQYYQPQQAQAAPPRRPLAKEEEEIIEPPQDYQFGFNVKDDLYTNYQKRKEQREGNKITGSYSVVDSDGFIRTVTYTADPVEGFKADVRREPTDIKIRIPQPRPQPAEGSQQPQYQAEGGPAARKQQTQQYLQASQAQQYQPVQAYAQAPQTFSPQGYHQYPQ